MPKTPSRRLLREMKRSLGPPWADDSPFPNIRLVYGPLREDEPDSGQIACFPMDAMTRAIVGRTATDDPRRAARVQDLPF